MFSTDSLSNMSLIGDNVASEQTMFIQAYDGKSWSVWDDFVLTSINII